MTQSQRAYAAEVYLALRKEAAAGRLSVSVKQAQDANYGIVDSILSGAGKAYRATEKGVGEAISGAATASKEFAQGYMGNLRDELRQAPNPAALAAYKRRRESEVFQQELRRQQEEFQQQFDRRSPLGAPSGSSPLGALGNARGQTAVASGGTGDSALLDRLREINRKYYAPGGISAYSEPRFEHGQIRTGNTNFNLGAGPRWRAV
jgi:hypothetical protein